MSVDFFLGITVALAVYGVYCMYKRKKGFYDGMSFYFKNKRFFELYDELDKKIEHLAKGVDMRLKWLEERVDELEKRLTEGSASGCGMMYSRTDEIKRLISKGVPDKEIIRITGCSYRELELVKEVFREKGSV